MHDLADRRIVSREILDAQLKALVAMDPGLGPVLEQAGEVPLRPGRPGFAGLVLVVCSQLLSVAAARTIHGRVEELVGEMDGRRFLAIAPQDLRRAGLSWSRINCLREVARAEMEGEVDFSVLHELEVERAMQILTSLKGIGTWSAEIYLLSSVAHPDIFVAGDLVLQKMLGKILGRSKRPDERQTRELSKRWSPYRGAAARLLWRYFAVLKNREGTSS